MAAPRRRLRTDALHILTLFTLAWAQPILDRHARHAWFLVASRVPPVDVVLLVLLLCLLLPGVLVAVEALAGLVSARLRNLLHAVFVLGLLLLLGYGLLSRVSDWSLSATFGMAWGLAALGVLAYLRVSAVQFFVTCLALSLLVVPANFLWQTKTLQALVASEPRQAAAASGATTPVVMVVFDELPLVSLLDGTGQIDPVLYPNFTKLANDAYWFQSATTVSDRTYYAVPSMLTGRMPDADELPNMLDHSGNLFTLLGGTYAMHVNETITDLCPQRLCLEAGPNLTERLNWVGRAALSISLPSDVAEPERPAIFSTFVDLIAWTDEAELYFNHTLLPHAPWWHLSSGQRHSDFHGSLWNEHLDEQWPDNAWQVTQAYQRHLLQVGFVDRLLGDLIERLKAVDLYDRALIVVVGDHGASFQPGENRRELAAETAAEIIAVPLIIKLPHQTERVVSDRNVQVVDILPSIADVLGIDVPWAMDGRSVFDPSQPEAPEKIVMSQTGERFTFGPTIEGVEDAVRRKIEIFGDGTDLDGLFRIGRYRDLIGQPVDRLPVADTSAITVELDDEAALAAVDPASDLVPARITGRLGSVPDVGEPVYLAVAVNGTVRAVTQSVVEEGAIRFSAMVPETSLRPGANTIDILLVDGPEEHPRISHLTRVHERAGG